MIMNKSQIENVMRRYRFMNDYAGFLDYIKNSFINDEVDIQDYVKIVLSLTALTTLIFQTT